MEGLQIDLSNELREFVESRVVLDRWSTSADFIRHLLENERQRWLQMISNMAQESIESGPMTEWSREDVENIRRQVRASVSTKRDGASQ